MVCSFASCRRFPLNQCSKLHLQIKVDVPPAMISPFSQHYDAGTPLLKSTRSSPIHVATAGGKQGKLHPSPPITVLIFITLAATLKTIQIQSHRN